MNARSKKRLKKILMVSCISVLVLLTLVYLFLGHIVKTTVETVVPKITGTQVKMESFSFSMMTGKIRIKNFVIGNPKDYKTEYAFKLGNLFVDIDMSTLLSKRLVINEIRIEEAKVICEFGLGTSNLGEIKSNIDKFSKGEKPKEQKAEIPKKTGEGKKVQINNFYFNGASVSAGAVLLQGGKVTLPIPDIHLKDIGKEEKGASIGEVADELFTAIYTSVGKAVGSGADALKGVGDESWNKIKGIFK